MLGTVVLAFFICLLPFRAFTLWIVVAPQETIHSLGVESYYNILYFCRTMHYLNSAINPILYNLMSSKFRDGFSRLCWQSKASVLLGRKGTRNSSTLTATTRSSTRDSFWRRSTSRGSRAVEKMLLHHVARECSVSVENGVCLGKGKEDSFL